MTLIYDLILQALSITKLEHIIAQQWFVPWLNKKGMFSRNNIDSGILSFLPEIILLLCVNRNTLCFRKKTGMFRNAMFTVPCSVTWGNFDKNFKFHKGVIILSSSVYVCVFCRCPHSAAEERAPR